MSDESEVQSKIDELLVLVKATHAKSITLEQQVASLRVDVAKLNERLTYREKVLVGWKEIGAYLKLSPKRARHLMNEEDLPVYYEGSSVMALATALDAWKARRTSTRNLTRAKPKIVIRESGETPS